MQIQEISAQPCEIKEIQPRARMNGDNKERTLGFKVVFNYSNNILDMLSADGQKWALPGLWNDEGAPVPGIQDVRFNRTFEYYKLVFKRNNKAVFTFTVESIHSWKAKPIVAEQFEVEFQVLGVCAEGDGDRCHKMLKDPGITLNIEESVGNQGSL